MQYAMLIYGDEDAWFAADEATVQSNMNEVIAWYEQWQAAGKIAEGGAELDHSRTAKTVGRDPDGRTMVTDGPFVELKEAIGGIILLEADGIDDAVAVAATWPGIALNGERVEVRPVMQR
jgi:hypothetical protein